MDKGGKGPSQGPWKSLPGHSSSTRAFFNDLWVGKLPGVFCALAWLHLGLPCRAQHAVARVWFYGHDAII